MAGKIKHSTEKLQEHEVPLKKSRISLEIGTTESNGKSINQCLKSFGKFRTNKVLSESSLLKTMCIEGYFGDDDRRAVVLLEKTPFQKEKLSELLTEKTDLTQKFENDIYGTYDAFTPANLNCIKVSVIHPATEKHIQKYIATRTYLVQETPDVYQNVTLPYLLSLQFSLEWVYNILKHEKEADRIIFEDNDPDVGFILLPDMKWNQMQNEDLHILALCHKKGIKSLRDLTSDHLPLLRNIKTKGLEVLKNKFKISSHELRIYFHYQPSYYHLHIHFTALAFDGPGSSIGTGHLLDTVINNLELFPDYYQRATLSFKVKTNNPLYDKLKEANVTSDA